MASGTEIPTRESPYYFTLTWLLHKSISTVNFNRDFGVVDTNEELYETIAVRNKVNPVAYAIENDD